MDRFAREEAGNPGRGGHRLAVGAGAVVEDTRRQLARLIGAPDPRRVVLTANCTHALNLALKGFLRPGDEVVTDSISHNSMARPLHALAQRGVKVVFLSPPLPTAPVAPEQVEAAISPATRLLAFTHASNVTGVVQPVAAYGEIARRRGVCLLVDAAQTAGSIPIDVEKERIDMLAFPGHKGLLGPQGTGGLYVSDRVELVPLMEGGTGTRSESLDQPAEYPSRLETGTLNAVGLAGLGAALKFLEQRGVVELHREVLGLRGRLVQGLAGIRGVELFEPPAGVERTAVVSFRIAGLPPGEAEQLLDQAFGIQVRGGLHCAPLAHSVLGTLPEGTVRVSPGMFNTADDIDLLLDAVRRMVAAGRGN